MSDSKRVATGGCLCGAVRYEVRGPLRDVINCHCSMCQRLHGGAGPHTKARKADITVTVDAGLAWYRTSEVARRGFCRICGSGVLGTVRAGTTGPSSPARSTGRPDLRRSGTSSLPKNAISTKSAMACRNSQARRTARSPAITDEIASTHIGVALR